eukprot:GHVS01008690.1.p1 GENE.GHVS01008690.1~~GHVS01008690.1.p1  ORF type:complete len:425 (-),score=87.22 GHVS01008690.1:324-1598(-)
MPGHTQRVGVLAWNGADICTSGSRDHSILNRDVRLCHSNRHSYYHNNYTQDYYKGVGGSGVGTATLSEHKQEVCGLSWNFDGVLLASGGNDNQIAIWDSRGGRGVGGDVAGVGRIRRREEDFLSAGEEEDRPGVRRRISSPLGVSSSVWSSGADQSTTTTTGVAMPSSSTLPSVRSPLSYISPSAAAVHTVDSTPSRDMLSSSSYHGTTTTAASFRSPLMNSTIVSPSPHFPPRPLTTSSASFMPSSSSYSPPTSSRSSSTMSAVSIYRSHRAAVKALAWCPHHRGVLASGGGTADRRIKFWNVLTDTLLFDLESGSQVCNIGWCTYRNEFVSTHGYSLNQIIVWKYPTLSKVATLTGHSARVLYFGQGGDEESICTAAGDGTVRFWKVFPRVGKKKKIVVGGGGWCGGRWYNGSREDVEQIGG